MNHKRDGLVPTGELDGTPQAQHHFTRATQINNLVSASEADTDMGFMARMMALCSLPRTNPGNRHQYKRANGPYTLVMFSNGETKLPYGNLARLLLAWVTTACSPRRAYPAAHSTDAPPAAWIIGMNRIRPLRVPPAMYALKMRIQVVTGRALPTARPIPSPWRWLKPRPRCCAR